MPNRVIRSQTISIGELLRLGSFQPARVQRDYCWTEHQQAALLNDLIASFGEFGLDPDSEPDVVPVEPRDGKATFPSTWPSTTARWRRPRRSVSSER